MPKIVETTSDRHIADARRLFEQYADTLGFSLEFQDFKSELNSLPGEYAPPEGRLLVAYYEKQPVGCVALRKIDSDTCEMKRLYVRPRVRGEGLGRKLAIRIIDIAREQGYKRMLLDTVPWMQEAIGLYESLGFRDTEPYRHNPIAGARFMALDL